jgi:hypothetical protein
MPVIGPHRWETIESIADRRRAAHPVWGFKDPRLCLFLPAWRHVVPGAKVLIVFRHFANCAHSLERRHAEQLADGFGSAEVHLRFWEEPDLALRMWLHYNSAVLRYADRYPRDVHAVSFDSVRRGYPLVEALRSRWGLPFEAVSPLAVLDPTITKDRTRKQPIVDRGLIDRLDQTLSELRRLEEASREAA